LLADITLTRTLLCRLLSIFSATNASFQLIDNIWILHLFESLFQCRRSAFHYYSLRLLNAVVRYCVSDSQFIIMISIYLIRITRLYCRHLYYGHVIWPRLVILIISQLSDAFPFKTDYFAVAAGRRVRNRDIEHARYRPFTAHVSIIATSAPRDSSLHI
jgi:hypothetical protein